MNKSVMTDYEVKHPKDHTIYYVILRSTGMCKYAGTISNCLAWLELTRLDMLKEEK